jgi:RNase P subunit RPR2
MSNMIPSLCMFGMRTDFLFFFDWKLTSSGKITTNNLMATTMKTTVVIHVNIHRLACASCDTIT